MNKHTPGPWEVVRYDDSINGGVTGYRIKQKGLEVGAFVCLVDDVDYGQSVSRANAILIESSPDMLLSLKILTDVVGLTQIAGNKEALQEAYDIAKAAIAKATGVI